ncbi:MAG TPA: alpha/beta fold hydrolase [Candidatus Krumholzibacterium sp.]|nr:alpha/beta fold hydrolase [Candidatus Krumholzibacterium sp.]
MSRLRYCFTLLLAGLLIAGAANGQEKSVQTGFMDVEGGKLYYEIAGEGDEYIVLVHDGLVHSAVWDNQFSVFSEMYRVVRYDRRGYGSSPMPEGSYSNIEDLLQVFTTLDIEKAALFGMSAGGGLVIDFTLAHPEKVSSLVVVGAVVSGFSYSEHMLTRGGRLTAADYGKREELMEYLIKEDPYEIAPQNEDVRKDLWKLMEGYPQNIDFTKNRLAAPPQRPAFGNMNEIQVPTLIVVGEFDIPDVLVHAGAIESGIPSAQRVIIREAGHLVPLEQPETFNEQVILFLRSAEFFRVLDNQGVQEAVTLYKEKHDKDGGWVPFTEARMNNLGYQYLQSGRTEEAIELFKLNVSAYPGSANAFDSLAEAYMANGDKESSIRNYRRSLELNPDNQNAKDRLKELE